MPNYTIKQVVNLNQLALNITLKEGKAKSLSIGQVKEVLRLTLLELKKISVQDLVKLMSRIK